MHNLNIRISVWFAKGGFQGVLTRVSQVEGYGFVAVAGDAGCAGVVFLGFEADFLFFYGGGVCVLVKVVAYRFFP